MSSAFMFAFVVLSIGIGASADSRRIDLRDSVALELETGGGVRWTVAGAAAAVAERPVTVLILGRDDSISTLTAGYATTTEDRGVVTGTTTVRTAAGSVFDVIDRYAAGSAAGSVTLLRSVTVKSAADADIGYRGEFAVRLKGPADLKVAAVFVPGIWYDDGRHTPASGMLQDLGRSDFLFREDRLPLPVVTIRDRSSGRTLSLIHLHPDGGTFAGEGVARTVVDDRLRFASLGIRRQGGVSVVFDDPGVEGDQTTLGRFKPVVRRAERFRPVRAGSHLDDQLMICLEKTDADDQAVRAGWRAAWSAFDPPVVPVAMQAVFDDSIAVLDHYFGKPSGVPGFPFAVTLPGGFVRDVSMQMGFVGEQIPCAAFLIGDGLSRHRPDRVAKGTAIVDFWAEHTLSPAGVPRTWYDVKPKPHWRDYPTYTRVATDGMRGMLRAWHTCHAAGIDHPAWLACCRSYGDWLVAHQGNDGSFVRAVDFDGKIVNASRSATTHPIRFLVDLWRATGDDRFLTSAKRAGDFALQDIGRNCNYYGGTADNDDVTDKEAGWIALDSFLSLYEVAREQRWLDAAERAGTFTETWLYGWNVPIPRDERQVTFPPAKTTAGMSLIAVGHSGADIFLAFAPFAYERLAVYTGDPHFADVARVLAYDTRQFVDVGGSVGYAVPGLVTEATTLAPPRGHGVNVWLPWCTAAMVEPMCDFQDAFGTVDVNDVLKMPAERQRAALDRWVRKAW
jgi:hypothetical protein